MFATRFLSYCLFLLLIGATQSLRADTAQAHCDIYPAGEDRASSALDCTFSQRQGYITIVRSDEVVHELSPSGEAVGNFRDQTGRTVYRQSGLGRAGLIFRFPDESVYVYWGPRAQEDSANLFSTEDYDAVTQLRCTAAGEEAYGLCPAGVLRMDQGQASIVVQEASGERYTVNFMADYVNATRGDLQAALENDVWILRFTDGARLEVPVAAIEGG